MDMEQRFWTKVNKNGPNGCWIWTAAVDGGGYGNFALHKGRFVKAHRLAYEMMVGQIPEGMNVLHRCDTPRCVNPSHLFLGTQADNMADMVSKNRFRLGNRNPPKGDAHYLHRHPEKVRRGYQRAPGTYHCGDDHYGAKLTASQVIAIRERYAAAQATMGKLASEYGVAKGTIQDIIERKTWKHI
jgi:hypothetical protein